MSRLLNGDASYALDAWGFLDDWQSWDTGFAEAMARRLALPSGLTLLHWKVVLFVHKAFASHGEVLPIWKTCCACGLSLKKLRELFPAGYLRGVCRLAGIPYETIAASHYALTYETAFREPQPSPSAIVGEPGHS